MSNPEEGCIKVFINKNKYRNQRKNPFAISMDFWQILISH